MRAMKKIVLLFILFAAPMFAATPITCTALAAVGYKYVYFGFTGTGPDTFAMAGSNDGVSWTSMGGTWASCGNGSPCGVNSPSAVCYGGNIYLLIAEAHDGALNSTKMDIGVLNTDYSVTTLLTFDWSSLGSVQTIFAGRWKKVPGYTNCFDVPVTFTSDYYLWSDYTACAALTTTSASISSGPTAVAVTGSANGLYDTQVIAYPPNSTASCVLVGTETDSARSYRYSALATGNCPNGPFTWQTNSGVFGSPLSAELTASTQMEGPNYIQTTIAGGWYFFAEDVLPSHQMYYSNCTPITLTSCVISPPVAWTEDKVYRAGTILSFAALPATTINGGTLVGGTFQ